MFLICFRSRISGTGKIFLKESVCLFLVELETVNSDFIPLCMGFDCCRRRGAVWWWLIQCSDESSQFATQKTIQMREDREGEGREGRGSQV